MSKGRKVLIGMQVLATLLFIIHYQTITNASWITWAVPLALLLLIAINSVWFTRFISWVIFGGAFFALLAVLSAFTLRWRLEPGFESMPFYRAMGLYAVMVYISLGQIKILGGGSHAPSEKQTSPE